MLWLSLAIATRKFSMISIDFFRVYNRNIAWPSPILPGSPLKSEQDVTEFKVMTVFPKGNSGLG